MRTRRVGPCLAGFRVIWTISTIWALLTCILGCTALETLETSETLLVRESEHEYKHGDGFETTTPLFV